MAKRKDRWKLQELAAEHGRRLILEQATRAATSPVLGPEWSGVNPPGRRGLRVHSDMTRLSVDVPHDVHAWVFDLAKRHHVPAAVIVSHGLEVLKDHPDLFWRIMAMERGESGVATRSGVPARRWPERREAA